MEEKQCENGECTNTFTTEGMRHSKRFCSRKCSKQDEYIRNKGRHKEYSMRPDVRERENKRLSEYYHNNKEHINERRKELYNLNPQPTKNRVTKYRKANPELIKEQHSRYESENKDKINKRRRYNYSLNPEPHITRSKEYINQNYEKVKKRRRVHQKNNRHKINQYVLNKIDTDEIYKLRRTVRGRVRNFIKRRGYGKDAPTTKLLGCDFETLKSHIEEKFRDGMTWDNHGSHWHLDHFIPLFSCTCKEDLFKLCHYTNLQPLLVIENLKKGSKTL